MLRAACLLITSIVLALGAQANIVHQPKFKVDGIVIVWSGGSGGIANTPPHASAGHNVSVSANLPSSVITGNIVPVAAPAGDLEALVDRATGTASFFVASNTAFSIDAELANPAAASPETWAKTRFSMAVTPAGGGSFAHGSKAQYPHSDGPDGGIDGSVRTLADLRTRTTVFRGNQRTAAAPGTITEQSVRFDVTYSAAGTEASSPRKPAIQSAADVIFTVFVP